MSEQLPDPCLTQVYRLEASLAEPLDLGATTRGLRRIAPRSGGALLGDIRYALQTDDRDLLSVQSRSIRHGSAEVLARLRRDDPVDASEYTFRASTQIETAAPELAWLNQGVFVSVGGRQATGRDLQNLRRRMKPAHHRDPV